jgi:hypothetical protein
MSSVLRSAYLYSESRDLVRNPLETTSYTVLRIKRDGSFALGEKTTGDLPKKVDRSTNILPNFMVESKDWILSVGKKFDAYWDGVEAVLSELKMVSELASVQAFRSSFVGIDLDSVKTTWVVPAIGDQELTNHPRVSAKWAALWASVLSNDTSFENWYQAAGLEDCEEGVKTHCMVTGDMCFPARIHRKVLNAPDSGGKAAFTSFGERSYSYLDRVEGENYAISKAVSFGYTAALSHIMSKEVRSCVGTSGNSTTLIWSADAKDDVSGIVAALSRYSKKEEREKVEESLKKISESKATLSVLSIRAATGRISVTGWDSVPVRDAVRNLKRFAEVMGIADYGVGGTLSRLGHGRSEISATVMKDVIRSILCGHPVPRAIGLHAAKSIANPAKEYDVGVRAKLNIGEGIKQWNRL